MNKNKKITYNGKEYTITPKRHNKQISDKFDITAFDLGKSECDNFEDLDKWLPLYYLDSDSNVSESDAIEYIEDYASGWISVL